MALLKRLKAEWENVETVNETIVKHWKSIALRVHSSQSRVEGTNQMDYIVCFLYACFLFEYQKQNIHHTMYGWCVLCITLVWKTFFDNYGNKGIL